VVGGQGAGTRGGRAPGGDSTDRTELGKAVSGERKSIDQETVSGQVASRASGEEAGGGEDLAGGDLGTRPARIGIRIGSMDDAAFAASLKAVSSPPGFAAYHSASPTPGRVSGQVAPIRAGSALAHVMPSKRGLQQRGKEWKRTVIPFLDETGVREITPLRAMWARKRE